MTSSISDSENGGQYRHSSYFTGNNDNYPYLARLAASDSIQSQALISVVEYFRWKKLAILTRDIEK
jgi:hypothetical protein